MFIIFTSIFIAGLSNLSVHLQCLWEKSWWFYQQTLITTGVLALLLDFNQNQVETFLFLSFTTYNDHFCTNRFFFCISLWFWSYSVSKEAIHFLSCLSDCHRRYSKLPWTGLTQKVRQPSVHTPKDRSCLHMHVGSKTA